MRPDTRTTGPNPAPASYTVAPARRIGAAAAALVVGLTLLVQVTPNGVVAPVAAQAAEKADYMNRINSTRAARGLQQLQVDAQLERLAEEWAILISIEGAAAHPADTRAGITTPWTRLGENVSVGPDSDLIWNAFMTSPVHYGNITQPEYDRVGIGVVWRDGIQYTVHRFMATAPAGGGDDGGGADPDPSPGGGATTPTPTPPAALPTPVPETITPIAIVPSRRPAQTVNALYFANTGARPRPAAAQGQPAKAGRHLAPIVHLKKRNVADGGKPPAADKPRSKQQATKPATNRSTSTSTTTTTTPRTSTTTQPRTNESYQNIFARILGREDKSRPVLFVHGINVENDSTDCGDAFDRMIAQFKGYGFTGQMVKVGYYANDVNCDVNLHDYGTYGDSDSWRQIGKAFSQYVYKEYTSKGIVVDVVGYSMGGLITRAAIYGTSKGEAGFSPPLDVEDVATLGTPHAGAPLGWWCFSGYQCATLASGHADIKWLAGNGNPQGKRGTEWTVIGSTNDWVVSVESALNMAVPGSRKRGFGDIWVNGSVQKVSHTGNTNYMHNDMVIKRAAQAVALPEM